MSDMQIGKERHASSILRIVHVSDYLMPESGYDEALLPKWNAKHGHEVHLVTSDRIFSPIADYENVLGKFGGSRICGTGEFFSNGVTVHRLPCSWERGPRLWIKGLKKKLAEIKPDVVFCHGSSSPTAFRLAWWAKRRRVPLLMDCHMLYVVMRRDILARLFYAALRIGTRLILAPAVYRFLGVAEECCDYLKQAQGAPAKKVECLPLALDTEIFKPDMEAGKQTREEFGIPPNAKVVIQTGKMIREKAPHWLSQAMAPIMEKDPDTWLLFVGSGTPEYQAEISAPAIEKGAGDRLVFLERVPVSQLAKIYCMADVCVYAGAASLSCIEAGGCGRAVIMTDLPVSKWRAEMGIGVCYKTGNIEDLTGTLKKVLYDNDYRRALGEKAHSTIISTLSYDTIARKSEDLMYEAIEEQTNAK